MLFRTVPRKFYLEIFFLFLALAVTVLYSVKSWRLYFFTGLANHWDPKLMGEWMAWNAHNILNGHFLFPNYHANFFYPHSYTLAFSELLWPESFLYAVFYFFSKNLFFSFNATMLFFWALSGVMVYVLLRLLKISPAVCVLAGFVYCLMPYRMPYYVEFNMMLVFIFPMMILLVVRWLEEPTYKNAAIFCFGYFISATSCLYYTIMTIVVMIFIFLAYIAANKKLLQNSRFYFSGIGIGIGAIAISIAYLYPYGLLRIQGGYHRSTEDYLKYYAQPMQYLDTAGSVLLQWIKTPRPRFTETFLFPGTTLTIIALIFVLYRCYTFATSFGSHNRLDKITKLSKCILWAFFWLVILAQACCGPIAWLSYYNHLIYYSTILLIVVYVVALFAPQYNAEIQQPRFLAGLAAAAVLCFFISFGPFISVGADGSKHLQILSRGPFLDFASWNPLFNAVRSLTRFSIVVLTYLTIAGAFVLNVLVKKRNSLVVLVPILIFALIYEARNLIHYDFRCHANLVNSNVIKKVKNINEDFVLFQLPIAVRNAEADIIMTTIGDFPLIIDGWSGFEPDYYQRLFKLEKSLWDVKDMTTWVDEIWPPAYLIIDREWVHTLEHSWHHRFPWQDVEIHWNLIDKDEKFALYRQKENILDDDKIIRRVRTDILKNHPVLSLKAHRMMNGPKNFSVVLNQTVVKEQIPLKDDWQAYTIDLPLAKMGNLKGDEVDLAVASDSGTVNHNWEVKDIDFKISK